MGSDSRSGRGRRRSLSSLPPRGMLRGAGSVCHFVPLAVVLLLPIAVSGCGLFEDVSRPSTKRIDLDGSVRFDELGEGQRAVDLLSLYFSSGRAQKREYGLSGGKRDR